MIFDISENNQAEWNVSHEQRRNEIMAREKINCYCTERMVAVTIYNIYFIR